MTEQHDPKYIYDWPDRTDVHEKAMKIISEEAHDSLGLEPLTTDPPELDERDSPALAPGLQAALSDAAETYYPSDRLANLLDQEMRELAHTALDDLPAEERNTLVRESADRIRAGTQRNPRPSP